MMKRTTLFLAISAAMAMPAQAVEIYNDGLNTATIGGHLTVQFGNVDWYQGVDNDAEITANSPRVNLAVTRDMGNGFNMDAKIETGMNMVEGGNSWTTRLGYIGVSHEDYGRLSAGKEWSTYYDAAWWTDMPIVFSSDQLGIYSNDTAGDDTGMGRADKALMYRKTFAMGDMGDLSFGMQWQGSDGALGARTGGSLIYAKGDWKVGASYVGGDVKEDYDLYGATVIDISEHGDELKSWQASVAYGSWAAPGLYFAAAYQEGTNTEAGLRFAGDSKGFEAITAWGFENEVNVFVSYRQLESDGDIDVTRNYGGDFADDGDNKWDESHVSFGVHKQLTANTMVYSECNVATGDDRDEGPQYAVGFRVFL